MLGTINVNGIDILVKPPLASVDILTNANNYTTDSDGLLTLTGLTNGDYTYTASKTGYITQTGNYIMQGASLTKELLMEAE